MKALIFIIYILLISIGLQAQDTIKVKGMVIHLKDIPFNRPYKIIQQSTKKSTDAKDGKGHYDPIVLVSKNKKQVALISKQENVLKAVDTSIEESTIEMYDNKGNIKWTTKKRDYTPCDGRISGVTGKSYFIWCSDEHIDKLILYDNQGKEEFSDDNALSIHSDANMNILYYQKKHEKKQTLYYYNSISKNNWSKTFDSKMPFTVLTISADGNYCLGGLVSDNNSKLLCIDGKGEVKWQRDFIENLGGYNISNRGDYIIRIINSKFWELYTGKGELIFKKEGETIRGYKFLPNVGCFVQNDETIISIASNISSNKSIVAFYDLKGKLLGHILVPYEGNYYVELLPDGKYHLYFNNQEVSTYFPKW